MAESSSQIGKYFEGAVEESMKALANQQVLCWYRLADSGSTGGKSAISSQPADYLVGCAGESYMLEVKSSAKHPTMQKSLMRPSQRNAIHRWACAHALPYYILFWSYQTGMVQLWDGREVLSGDRGLNDKRGLIAEDQVSDAGGWMIDKQPIVKMLDRAFACPTPDCVQEAIKESRHNWSIR